MRFISNRAPPHALTPPDFLIKKDKSRKELSSSELFLGVGGATRGDCPLLPCLSLLPTPVPTSPQFTNSLSLGLFTSHKTLSPQTMHMRGGQEGPQGLEIPGTRSCRLRAGRATKSRASAVQLARDSPAQGSAGRLAPERQASWPWRPHTRKRAWRGSWVPRAHENSSRRRCALPPQVASSPASAGGGRGRGHSPLRSPSPGARAPPAAGLPPAPQSRPSEVSSLHLAVPSLSPDFRATLLSLLALRVAGRLMFAMPSRPMTPT